MRHVIATFIYAIITLPKRPLESHKHVNMNAWLLMLHACQYIGKITSVLSKTTFYFITFYSSQYILPARAKSGNGGKMTPCDTI